MGGWVGEEIKREEGARKGVNERERERERENPTTHDQTQQFSCPGKKRSRTGSNPKVRYSEHAKAETWVRIEIEKNLPFEVCENTFHCPVTYIINLPLLLLCFAVPLLYEKWLAFYILQVADAGWYDCRCKQWLFYHYLWGRNLQFYLHNLPS